MKNIRKSNTRKSNTRKSNTRKSNARKGGVNYNTELENILRLFQNLDDEFQDDEIAKQESIARLSTLLQELPDDMSIISNFENYIYNFIRGEYYESSSDDYLMIVKLLLDNDKTRNMTYKILTSLMRKINNEDFSKKIQTILNISNETLRFYFAIYRSNQGENWSSFIDSYRPGGYY